MMGINKCTFSIEIKRLGLGHGEKHGGYRKWDKKEDFLAWANGVPKEEATEEQAPETEEVEECVCTEAVCEEVRAAIPSRGNLVFEGKVDEILKSVGVLLGGAYVHINITWGVENEPFNLRGVGR